MNNISTGGKQLKKYDITEHKYIAIYQPDWTGLLSTNVTVTILRDNQSF